VDPGLYGCIAALVWVLYRHGMSVPHPVVRQRRLARRHRRVLGVTRLGVASLGAAVFAVAIAKIGAPVLPGTQGPFLYLGGVGTALALVVAVEVSILRLRNAIAREARAAARRARARSVHTMMRLGLGPRSE
jgi:heme exporter protein D